MVEDKKSIIFESMLGMCMCNPPSTFCMMDENGHKSHKNYFSKYCICGKLWEDHHGISIEKKISMREHYYD